MIDWISVDKRVPEDRRDVLVWGACWWGPFNRFKPTQFLGKTRYNAGGRYTEGRFDIEKHGGRPFSVAVSVTHWAEITGPSPLPTAPS